MFTIVYCGPKCLLILLRLERSNFTSRIIENTPSSVSQISNLTSVYAPVITKPLHKAPRWAPFVENRGGGGNLLTHSLPPYKFTYYNLYVGPTYPFWPRIVGSTASYLRFLTTANIFLNQHGTTMLYKVILTMRMHELMTEDYIAKYVHLYTTAPGAPFLHYSDSI